MSGTPIPGGAAERPSESVDPPAQTATLTVDELLPVQRANLSRYRKKLPAAAQDTIISQLADGLIRFETRVPGRVPGSYALYTKTIDTEGATVAYTKTTVVPDGSVAHVKDKMGQ